MTNSRVFSGFWLCLLWRNLWPCTISVDLCLFYKKRTRLQRNAVSWRRMITRQQNGLVCFAFCSTPARSCSEELVRHSSTLAANATAGSVFHTSPISTAGGHSPVTHQRDVQTRKGAAAFLNAASAEGDDKQACQIATSPKCIITPSPSSFLPVPTAMATASTETADTCRQKGKPRRETDPHEGRSWVDSSLPATWAPSSSYTVI